MNLKAPCIDEQVKINKNTDTENEVLLTLKIRSTKAGIPLGFTPIYTELTSSSLEHGLFYFSPAFKMFFKQLSTCSKKIGEFTTEAGRKITAIICSFFLLIIFAATLAFFLTKISCVHASENNSLFLRRLKEEHERHYRAQLEAGAEAAIRDERGKKGSKKTEGIVIGKDGHVTSRTQVVRGNTNRYIEELEDLNFPSEYGAWSGCVFTRSRNNDKDNTLPDSLKGLFLSDTRLFWKGYWKKDNYFYTRLRNRYYIVNSGPGYGGKGDRNELTLDQAYFYYGYPGHELKAGRAYYSLGTGILMGGNLDGFEIITHNPKWDSKNFIAMMPRELPNLDQSKGGLLDGSTRYFFGGEFRILSRSTRQPYLLYLVELDEAKENPEDPAQHYKYDSIHLGAGIEGQARRNMRYWIESLAETGISPAFGSNTATEKINATALSLGYIYYWDIYSHPVHTLEYAYGSGDPQRTSVTNTVGGNPAGTKDQNFIYYGSTDLGSVLRPRLSNLAVWRLGVFFYPWESSPKTKKLQTGMKYSIYSKVEPAGGISDSLAIAPASQVGHELSLHLNWRYYSDWYIFAEYGHFTPGLAYPAKNRDKNDFLMLGYVITY